MRYGMSKQQLKTKLRDTVNYKISDIYLNDYESIQKQISRYVKEAISVTVDELIENTYSDEDFERDIGLKD